MFCPPGRQRDPGKNARESPWGPSWLPFFRPWPQGLPRSIVGPLLSPFWTPFGSLLAPLPSIWAPFGSLLFPFAPRGGPQDPPTTTSTHQPTNPSTNLRIFQSIPCPGPAVCAKRLNKQTKNIKFIGCCCRCCCGCCCCCWCCCCCCYLIASRTPPGLGLSIHGGSRC